jgi:hypothetical protein
MKQDLTEAAKRSPDRFSALNGGMSARSVKIAMEKHKLAIANVKCMPRETVVNIAKGYWGVGCTIEPKPGKKWKLIAAQIYILIL